MVLSFIIAYFSSFLALGQSESCYKEFKSNSITKFAQEYLEQWGASGKQVLSAKCRNPGNPSDEQMRKYLERKNVAKNESTSFFGMSFENEDPRLLDLMKRLTEYDSFLSLKKEPEKQKQFQISNDCKKVICAAESIFGKERAIKLLYALDKYEINLSHLTDSDLADWKSRELDLILEAADDLPSHLIPFNRNQYFKHYKRGWGPSQNTVANAVIMVFFVWEDLDNDGERISSLIHEIGHNIGSRLNQDESSTWLNLSGWVEKEGKWKANNKEQIISNYAYENPAEDFAETFVAFRYNPLFLKKRSPKKYEYMKNNIFLGLEYTDEEKCNESNSSLHFIKSQININQVPLQQKFSSCKKEIADIIQRKDVDLKACIKKEKIRIELERLMIGKSEQEINTITNASQFHDFDVKENISDKEELEVYRRIIGDIYGSITQTYSNYDIPSCERKKEYGWINFIPFNKFSFNDEYELPGEKEMLNKFVFEICSKQSNKKTLTCEDLKKDMRLHLPKRFQQMIMSEGIEKYHLNPKDKTNYVIKNKILKKDDIKIDDGAASFRCIMD